MVPDIPVRLQSMLRAMIEVVVPGIDAENRIALEQAHLVIAFLKLIEVQHCRVFEHEMTELREFHDLLMKLLAAAEGGQATRSRMVECRRVLERAAPMVELVLPRQAEVVATVRSLRESADNLVRAAHEDGGGGFRASATALVMQQSEQEIRRMRTWVATLGMDPDPSSLPSIDAVLS